MGSKAEFEAAFNLSQVNAELQKTQARVDGTITGYGGLEKALTRTEVSTRSFSGYLAQANKELDNFEYKIKAADVGSTGVDGALKRLRPTLGASAAAISMVSAALGDQAGASGKVINLGGQMLAAYSAGGPYGLALAAGIAGTTLLTSHWDDLIKKQDEAIRKQYLGLDDATSLLNKVESELLELHARTMNSSAAAFARVAGEIKEVEAKKSAAAKDLLSDAQVRRLKELQDAGMFTGGEDPAEILAANERRKVQITLLDQVIGKLEQKQGLESADAAGGLGDVTKMPLQQVTKRLGSFDADEYTKAKWGISLSEFRDGAIAAMEADAKARHDFDAQTFAGMQDAAEQKLAIDKRYYDAKAKLAELDHQRIVAIQQRQAQLYAEVLGIVAGATEQMIADVINGQEHAVERFAATMFKQAGTAMIGHGINALAGGLSTQALILAPETGGASSIATGAALIAGGLALGGVGAGIDKAIGGGGGSTSAAARSPGVNTGGGGRARGQGEGGGVTINIVYGAAGPAPQDTGREVHKALIAFQRSSGNRAAFGPQGPTR
jgi:hypothetical protein